MEVLRVEAWRCDSCELTLELPYAMVGKTMAAVGATKSGSAQVQLVSLNHGVDLFTDTQGNDFMVTVNSQARGLQAMGVEFSLKRIESEGVGHARAFLNLRKYPEGMNLESFHERLLKKYLRDQASALPENLLKSLPPAARPLNAKYVLLKREDYIRKNRLLDSFRANRLTLDHDSIMETFKRARLDCSLVETASGVYELVWDEKLKVRKEKSIERVLRKTNSSMSVAMSYGEDESPRIVSPQSYDERGFLGYTPSGYRRFLWSRIRAVGTPRRELVTREIIRLQRYDNGMVRAFIDSKLPAELR